MEALNASCTSAHKIERNARTVEVSIVMPCLNESDTLSVCIEKAQEALRNSGIVGEIIVADNGSTDRSPLIASTMGARVVHVEAKGYGNALMGGIAAALGDFIIMGDADDSYDFREIPKFVEKLRAGADLVQGCRLPSGGGRIMPGAMPFSHRWFGNPMSRAGEVSGSETYKQSSEFTQTHTPAAWTSSFVAYIPMTGTRSHKRLRMQSKTENYSRRSSAS